MHGARPREASQKAGRPQAQGKPQFRYRPGAFGPVWMGRGKGAKVGFIVETGHGIIGLGAQKRALDRAGAGTGQ